MRFLADESCDFTIVRALRAAGHDVVAVSEISPRADDAGVIAEALVGRRVLLTEDKDFGQLVYAEGHLTSGVILVRFPASARRALPGVVVEIAREHGESLYGAFVVIGPARIRISRPARGGSDVAVSDATRRASRWQQIQTEIAGCRDCCERWPAVVTDPLSLGELPSPPPDIDVLFVGVAPTRSGGRSRGTHFYSTATDNLRRGLFRLLASQEFELPLLGLDLEAGNRAFHDARCFFVHAAKARPTNADAPPRHVIAYCASRHLRHEISVLNPRAVCFLGATHLAPTAAALFERRIGGTAVIAQLGSWRGPVVLAPQPVRGRASRTAAALLGVWPARSAGSPEP